jgi:anti-sigma regulatory factor (Ser/Thr protein kinase)
MKMILLMSRLPKIALTKDNETLVGLQKRAAKVQKLTEVEQINLENKCTELVKNQVDYGNKHYLKSFALRLEME